jgi:UDP-N-acetylmuramate--alanine ligase
MKKSNYIASSLTPQSLGIIHFVGIGGIGMSGIAEILHSLDYQVRGSDTSENANVCRLRSLGIPCFIGHAADQVIGASVLVVSSAIHPDNPEMLAARKMHLPIVKRAEMLAEIMRFSPSIAVAGTHGKTTTTSLGAAVLETAGLDPTVVSGGIINAYGTNARLGEGPWTIVEADESDGTFTKLPATIAIVTNIDAEHMDYFGTYERLYDAFKTYVHNIPFYGLGILCYDHPQTRLLSQEVVERRIITYGLCEGADVQADIQNIKPEGIEFSVAFSEHFFQICRVSETQMKMNGYFLPMVGKHNIQNALSIIACGLELGLSHAEIQKGLAQFQGVKRRFTHVGQWKGIAFIDDYAHHPQEISAALTAAKQVAKGKVIAVIQPHRYSRLRNLFQEFCECFEQADHVIVTPVYAAGEKPDIALTHHTLADGLAKSKKLFVETVSDPRELSALLRQKAEEGDFVVFLGAGDITQWAYQVFRELASETEKVYEKVVNE